MNSEETSEVEIDLESFSKEELIHILTAMHLRDETFNQFAVRVLTEQVKIFEKNLKFSQS